MATQEEKRISDNWLIAIAVLVFISACFLILITLGITAFVAQAYETPFLSILVIVQVAMGGILGGLAFEIVDESFDFPRRDKRTKSAFSPGCLGSMLFGLIGGFVIFLIVPGDYNITDVMDNIKLFAMATLGGYGGRVLIEQALKLQLKRVEKQIEDLQSQHAHDAKTMSLVEQQLDGDPDTEVDPAELKEHLEKASSSAAVWAFDQARQFRRACLHDKKKDRRDKIELAVPVFEGLIAKDRLDNEEEKYHRNFGQLGYALKDKQPPEYQRAMENLITAIEVRDRVNDKGYRMYELNRAICKMKLDKSVDSVRDDLEEALKDEKTKGILTNLTDEETKEKSKDLIQWLQDHQDELGAWMDENDIEV